MQGWNTLGSHSCNTKVDDQRTQWGALGSHPVRQPGLLHTCLALHWDSCAMEGGKASPAPLLHPSSTSSGVDQEPSLQLQSTPPMNEHLTSQTSQQSYCQAPHRWMKTWQHNLLRVALFAAWHFPVFHSYKFYANYINLPLYLRSCQRTGTVC